MSKTLNILLPAVVLFAGLGLAGAQAQTFYYVMIDDTVAATEADNATMALMNATNIKYNSGVISADAMLGLGASMAMNDDDSDTSDMDMNDTEEEFELTNASTGEVATDDDMETYAYVTSAGRIKYVEAATPEQALTMATDIAMHSGVVVTSN